MANRTHQRPKLLTTTRGDWTFRYRTRVIQKDGSIGWEQKRHTFARKDYPAKKVAEKYMDDFIAAYNSPDHRPLRSNSFKEYAEMWLAEIVKNYKPSSANSTKSQLNARLIPFFGAMQMKEIDLLDVQRYVSGAKVGVETVRNDVNLLHLMCRKAKKYGFTDRTWDMQDVDFPRKTKNRTPPHFTEAQMKLIIENGGKFRLLFLVIAVTGVRIGEALALKTSDLDAFAQPLPILRVRRSLYKKQEQTPKTTNSYRYFRLPEWLCNELLKAGEGFIFKDKDGEPYGDHAPRYYLEKVKTKFGLTGAFHAFRHGQASMMGDNLVPDATKKQRLGHGSISMTNHYTHPNDANEIAWAQKVGEMFKPEVIQ